MTKCCILSGIYTECPACSLMKRMAADGLLLLSCQHSDSPQGFAHTRHSQNELRFLSQSISWWENRAKSISLCYSEHIQVFWRMLPWVCHSCPVGPFWKIRRKGDLLSGGLEWPLGKICHKNIAVCTRKKTLHLVCWSITVLYKARLVFSDFLLPLDYWFLVTCKLFHPVSRLATVLGCKCESLGPNANSFFSVLCLRPKLLLVYFMGKLFQTEKLSSCLTSVCADSSQLSGGDLWLPLTGQRNPALLLPEQRKSVVCLLPEQKLFVQQGVSPYCYLLVLVCVPEIGVAVWEAARRLQVAARPEGPMPGIFQPCLSVVSGAWWHRQSLPSPRGRREWSARGPCWQLV